MREIAAERQKDLNTSIALMWHGKQIITQTGPHTYTYITIYVRELIKQNKTLLTHAAKTRSSSWLNFVQQIT